MTHFDMTTTELKKTIELPLIFLDLPKDIQDLVFECNYEHREQMKIVLDQLINYIFCINCDKIIAPSLLNRVNCCSSICMYQLQDDPYHIHM